MKKNKKYFLKLYESNNPWGYERYSQIYRLNKYIEIISTLDGLVKNKYLDIGCANGIFISKLTKKIIFNIIDGIDFGKILINEGNVLFKNRENINLCVSELPEIKTNSNNYNLITAFEILYYLDSKSFTKTIDNVLEKTKQNGYFIFTEEYNSIKVHIDSSKWKTIKYFKIFKNYNNLLDKAYYLRIKIDKILYLTGSIKKIDNINLKTKEINFLKKIKYIYIIFYPFIYFILKTLSFALIKIYKSKTVHTISIKLSKILKNDKSYSPRYIIILQKK